MEIDIYKLKPTLESIFNGNNDERLCKVSKKKKEEKYINISNKTFMSSAQFIIHIVFSIFSCLTRSIQMVFLISWEKSSSKRNSLARLDENSLKYYR